MIDYFAIGLTHGLLALAAWRLLLRADLGTEVAVRIADAVGSGRYDKAISADEVKSVVATEVEKVLAPVQFALADFRTTPEGGGFALSAASEAGERFDWRGRLALAPVASRGEFSIRGLKARSVWEFLSEQLPFELGGGEIDLA